ncbi:MAG: hypothetical protein ACI9LM_002026 [Alteromonadaceae bacterium]|jgi:hypothetical protein
MKAYALKAQIRITGSELYRIGRSRNWQLKANLAQLELIINAIESADEPSWQWLAKHLNSQKKNLSHDDLVRIAKRNSGISMNQLMAKTDCTIAQARQVLDELEELD